MSDSSLVLDLSPDVDGYFSEVVDDAVRARGVSTSDATKHYLAGLLGDYARGALTMETLERPLTLLLQEALDQTGAARFERLRRIGDGVLYALGFFGPRMTRHGADPRYVMVIGSSAYGHASSMLRLTGGGGAPDVLQELAEGYGSFVAVMTEVAEAALAPATEADSGVLRLYERWKATGSERLAGALVKHGLCPQRGPGGVH
ncbi:MAG: hypothetical protein FJ095_18940 [Deltaproteobacteria bacterium]|nr:hypothetical protein [Deltaproteobacteria bacterium]